MSEAIRAAVAELRQKRDAMSALIASLEAVYGPVPVAVIEAPTEPKRSRQARERRVNPKKRQTFAAAGVDAVVAARDQAVIKALQNNPALRSAEIATRMPKEPGLTPEQAKAAISNTLTRLRAKSLIGRTGDVWSLSGAGDRSNG